MDQGFTPTLASTPYQSSIPVSSSNYVSYPQTTTKGGKLPRDANRILFVRGLPYKASADELYDVFGKYGSVRQIRKGVTPATRGTAYVVYHDVFDAKNAVDHLSGFNVCGRYLIVVYYDPAKEARRAEKRKAEEENEILKRRAGFI